MEYLYLLFIMIVVIQKSSALHSEPQIPTKSSLLSSQKTFELNPDILKYDNWIKDAETTVKRIKADEKRRAENQMNTGAYIPNKRETDVEDEISTTTKRYRGFTVYRAPEDETTPEWIYRNVVERCISLFWGQEEQILELKTRERQIQKKTKANIRPFSNIIKEVDDYIREELNPLADKFYNPKCGLQEGSPPLKPEVVPYFLNAWDRMEKIVDDDLQKLQGFETEIEEIRGFIQRGRDELPLRSEDIQKQMKKLAERKRELELGIYTTTEGTTTKEWVLSVQSLRRNDTRRASCQ